MFSCNLRFRLIFLHGCSRTHCVASLRAVPVGRISYNLYFDCKHVRSVTCDLINEYTCCCGCCCCCGRRHCGRCRCARVPVSLALMIMYLYYDLFCCLVIFSMKIKLNYYLSVRLTDSTDLNWPPRKGAS